MLAVLAPGTATRHRASSSSSSSSSFPSSVLCSYRREYREYVHGVSHVTVEGQHPPTHTHTHHHHPHLPPPPNYHHHVHFFFLLPVEREYRERERVRYGRPVGCSAAGGRRRRSRSSSCGYPSHTCLQIKRASHRLFFFFLPADGFA